MIVVAGTVRVEPSKMAAARVEMEKMIVASRAEDGCVAYSYAIDVLDPQVVRVFEVWRDKASLERHFTMPHLAAWRAAWPSIGLSERNLKMYEVGAYASL